MRYFIHLGYDGTNYMGWQRQNKPSNTVQEVVEKGLSQIFKKSMCVYGCGRTDVGVYSSQYVIQIDLDKAPVFEVIEVKEDQHCLHDAVACTYDYFIHVNKDPILFRYSSCYVGLILDYDL